MSWRCPCNIFSCAISGENHCARSTSGKLALRPLFGGHSNSNVFDLRVAGSKSPSSAKAVTTLRPGCVTSPSGRSSPRGRIPVSSSNSRSATSSGFSASEYSPFGIDQAPRSFLAQNGPPGCTSRSSRPCAPRRYIRMPALRFGTTTLLVGRAGQAHPVLGFLDHLCRHRIGAIENHLDLLAADLLKIDIGLGGFRDQAAILHGGTERLAQRRHPVGRCAGRQQQRTIHVHRREDELQDLLGLVVL